MPVPTQSFGGDFHLHDIYRSTDVSNGGKTVECSNTCDSTNYSKEVFTDADSFTVELKVEKLCGGRVHLGLVPADIGHLPTSNYTCGEHEIESSLACVIEPGHVRVLTRDRWVFHGDCNTSDPTVMRFEFTKGALSFSIDDAMLSPAELRKYNVEGRFRLGVSLPKAGQRATLRVVSGGEPSFSTQPTKFHLSGSYVSTELDDDCKTLECVRAFNSTHYSAEVFDARASFAVQLKVDRLNGGAVHFGILDHDVDAPTSSNNCGDSGLPGSVACVVADGEARIRHRGSYIFRGDTDTSDPVLMRLEFHGGKLSFAVDGRNVSSQALRDITFTGRYRIGVSLPKAGQKAVLDSPPVMAVSRSESHTCYDGDFHLQDEYLSTELCNGGKTIDCIRTTDSTNFSREIFSHEDSFTVELKIEKLCGGRVHLGFVPAQVEDFPTSRFTCGEKELYPSLACVIEPGKVRLLTRDRWTFTGSCNTSNPTVMRFQFTKGSLSFSIDGVDLPESALQQEVQGSYRLGVSLTTEGQRATLPCSCPLPVRISHADVMKGCIRHCVEGSNVSQLHPQQHQLLVVTDWDARTLTSRAREAGFASACAAKPFDVICLQEFDPAWQRSIGREYEVVSYHRSFLAVAFCRRTFHEIASEDMIFGSDKGMLGVVLEHTATGRRLAVVNVHLPFGHDDRERRDILSYMMRESSSFAARHQVRSVIVTGDCNQDIRQLPLRPEWEVVTDTIPGTARSPVTDTFTAIDHVLTLKGGGLSARSVTVAVRTPDDLIPHRPGAVLTCKTAFSDHAAVHVTFDAW